MFIIPNSSQLGTYALRGHCCQEVTTGAWGRKSRHPLQHYHGPKALGLGQAPSPSSVGLAPTHFPPSVGRQQSKRCSPARPTPTAATPSTACSMLHAAGPLFKTPGAGGLGPPSPCVGLQEGLDPKDHFPKKKNPVGPHPQYPHPGLRASGPGPPQHIPEARQRTRRSQSGRGTPHRNGWTRVGDKQAGEGGD